MLARIEVLARRRDGRGEETVYRVGDLELDRLSHRVTRGDSEIVLQPREVPPARIPDEARQRQVVTRTMLLENVWDYHFDPQTNVIDAHVAPALEDRQGLREAAAAHRARGRLRDPRVQVMASGEAVRMSGLGKLLRTTAKLSLCSTVFALFAAVLIGYFAWTTSRLITQQITETIDAEINGLTELYQQGGIRRLVLLVDARSRRPLQPLPGHHAGR